MLDCIFAFLLALFAFSLLVCFPAITYISYYVSYFLFPSATLDIWGVALSIILAPIVILGAIRLVYGKIERKDAILISRILLVYYVLWSIVGGYVLNVFYQEVTWILIQFMIVVPIVLIGMIRFIYDTTRRNETVIVNRFLLVFCLSCLIIGSYLLPVFYSGYFAQSTVPTYHEAPTRLASFMRQRLYLRKKLSAASRASK